METLVNNLNALLAASGKDFDDTLQHAKLRYCDEKENSYLTIWYSSSIDEYVLAHVCVNHKTLEAEIFQGWRSGLKTLEETKAIFGTFFMD